MKFLMPTQDSQFTFVAINYDRQAFCVGVTNFNIL